MHMLPTDTYGWTGMNNELVSRGTAWTYFQNQAVRTVVKFHLHRRRLGFFENGMFSEEGQLPSPAASVLGAQCGPALLRSVRSQGEVWSSPCEYFTYTTFCLCSGAGRTLAMGHCRLCHGKFSSRSLRSISDRVPGETSERLSPGERVFIRDFQCLLGVAVLQDPALPQFVCKNCYTQFYQCHSLLRSFLQRVNVSPAGQRKPCTK